MLPQSENEEALNLFHLYVVGSGRGPGVLLQLMGPMYGTHPTALFGAGVANPALTPVTGTEPFWTVSLAPTCPDDWPRADRSPSFSDHRGESFQIKNLKLAARCPWQEPFKLAIKVYKLDGHQE